MPSQSRETIPLSNYAMVAILHRIDSFKKSKKVNNVITIYLYKYLGLESLMCVTSASAFA
jgi:hypothetical protein